MSSAKPKNIARHVRENTTMWGEGIAFFESGDYAKAEETFSSMDFVTSAVLFNSGTCSLAQGDIEKAIEVSETVDVCVHICTITRPICVLLIVLLFGFETYASTVCIISGIG